jgi:hypothetical protein
LMYPFGVSNSVLGLAAMLMHIATF